MQSVATIGLDIAKSVCQVHGVDAAGQVVLRRQLKRRYVLTFFEKLTGKSRPHGDTARTNRCLHSPRCSAGEPAA